MPHWAVAVIGVATTLASWRWLVRPAVRAGREALALLRQIKLAASGIATLTFEVRSLAGSIVTLAAAMLDDQTELRREHVELRDNHRELTQLVVDLDADVRRIEKLVRKGG